MSSAMFFWPKAKNAGAIKLRPRPRIGNFSDLNGRLSLKIVWNLSNPVEPRCITRSRRAYSGRNFPCEIGGSRTLAIGGIAEEQMHNSPKQRM
jgi:hypothetical protein